MTLITRCSLRLREVINLIFISLNREGAWRKCFSGKEACCMCIRRVWIYKRGYHNLYIKEEQTTQRPKEKVQKDKQRVPSFPSETHELYSYSLLQKKCLPRMVRWSCSPNHIHIWCCYDFSIAFWKCSDIVVLFYL